MVVGGRLHGTIVQLNSYYPYAGGNLYLLIDSSQCYLLTDWYTANLTINSI